MKRYQLQLDHYYKNRFVGRRYLNAGRKGTTLGSSRKADIRLLGDSVGELHAYLEWQNDTWILSDLGSNFGTWIQKQPVVHQEIVDLTVIQIGQHQIKLLPIVLEQQLFHKNSTESLYKNGELYHQIVVRKKGLLVQNILHSPQEPYELEVGLQKIKLPIPADEHWVTIQEGELEIRQRRVKVEKLKDSVGVKFSGVLKSDLRGPILLATLMLLILIGMVILWPQEPKGVLTAINPEDQNQYTRMIYDAVKVKKQKVESQKLTQKMASKMDKVAAPNLGGSQKMGGGGSSSAQVVNRLKASHLSALIGKISARAAKNTDVIRSLGVTPNVVGSGMALGTGRTVSSSLTREASLGLNKSHKLGGVGTSGRGGGSSTYKGFGGMAIGNVGNASVGMLEEESEVEGGLDKDIIARYIKSQLGQIRYCYERQLSANPDLYGKVLVKFSIGSSGEVTSQSIGNSSLSSNMVEGCILRRVASWRFPAPKGGTKVIVSYPFLFKSTR